MVRRQARPPLTQRSIATAIAAAGNQWLWDGKVAGFGVRIYPDPPSGASSLGRSASYFLQYRIGSGRGAPVRRMMLAAVGQITLDQARQVAQKYAGHVAEGRDPFLERRAQADAERDARSATRSAKRNTVAALSKRFMAEEITPQNRRAAEYQRIIDRYIVPELGNMAPAEVKRSHVLNMLSKVRTGALIRDRGPRKQGKDQPSQDRRAMAHLALAVTRRMFNWHGTRTEGFVSPIVAGMSPIARPKEMQRDRVLTDDEIRAVWEAAEQIDFPYGALVRWYFLSAVRRDEGAGMKWTELEAGSDLWTIPAARMKNKQPHVVPLSRAARDLLHTLPRLSDERGKPSPFVFTANGLNPFNGFSKAKARLDTLSGTSGWRLHDIRRTVRGLMTRGGISSDTAERVLAHTLQGVRAVYDRYDYLDEKRHALNVLAQQIDAVLRPPPDKIIRLGERA